MFDISIRVSESPCLYRGDSPRHVLFWTIQNSSSLFHPCFPCLDVNFWFECDEEAEMMIKIFPCPFLSKRSKNFTHALEKWWCLIKIFSFLFQNRLPSLFLHFTLQHSVSKRKGILNTDELWYNWFYIVWPNNYHNAFATKFNLLMHVTLK